MPQRQLDIATKLEQTYAQALLGVIDGADDAALLATVADEAGQLRRLIEREPDLVRLVATRTLSTRDRAGMLERLFATRLTEVLYRFVQVVNRKNRLDDLGGILRAFARLVDERGGVVAVDAHVPALLADAAVSRLAASIGAALGREARVRQRVEPDLIGGLKLRIGDRLIDGSVAAQLRLMRAAMTAAGRQRAREAVRPG